MNVCIIPVKLVYRVTYTVQNTESSCVFPMKFKLAACGVIEAERIYAVTAVTLFTVSQLTVEFTN